LKGLDELKDQSYFLSQIDGSILARFLFPVGEFKKLDVRKLAKEIGLEKLVNKKSSVGICFIGKRKFSEFIDQYLPPRPGRIVNLDDGSDLGEHKGLHHFTIGQRIGQNDGLNIQTSKAFFVAQKDTNSNKLLAV
jgi:tRNA U34 2-thiouridine synthase MnmA/TrmU